MFKTVLVPTFVDSGFETETLPPLLRAIADQSGVHVCPVSVDRHGLGQWWFRVTGDGEAVEEILAQAKNHPGPVIVLDASRRGPLGRRAIATIIRTAPCPVLVTRPESAAETGTAPDISTVVVPLDRSAFSEAGLEVAIDGLGPAVNHVHLVHVVEPLPRVRLASDDVHVVVARPAQGYLEGVAERMVERGVRASWEIRRGLPAEEIARVAVERNAGLIAMASHARTGLSRWLTGSVAVSVLGRSASPVLLVRPNPARRLSTTAGAEADLRDHAPTPEVAVPRVADLMSRLSVVAREGSQLDDVVRTMAAHRLDSVPVVDDDGVLRGVIAAVDVVGGEGVPIAPFQVSRVLSMGSLPGRSDPRELGRTLTAARLMTRPPLTATADEPAAPLVERMTSGGLDAVPVIDGAGRPVGLVTRHDLLKLLVTETPANGSSPRQIGTLSAARERRQEMAVAGGAGVHGPARRCP